MADIAISALMAASALSGTEVVPVVQGGTTKKATQTQMLAPAVLLSGRTGGQTVYGGDGAGDDLTLKTSSHGTKGTISLADVAYVDETGGWLAVGANSTTASVNGASVTGKVGIWVDDGGQTVPPLGMGKADNSAATAGATLFGARSRGTLATPLVVQNGDLLSAFIAVGFDGTDYAQAARIDFDVDGTPGSNDMPGRIVFLTSPDGGQVPAEALRISQDKTISSSGPVVVTTTGKTLSGVVGSTERFKVDPSVADGGSAVGYVLDTATTLATSGAKLVSVRNAGSELVYVDKDGMLATPDQQVSGTVYTASTTEWKIGTKATSGYGWNDIISEVVLKGSGAGDPAWANFRDGMYGYSFSASAMKETFHRFHILHDYATGTVLYPHIHWSPNTTSTGVVRWGFEYSVAKGHQQGAGSTFGATTTVYVEQSVNTSSQYQHFVAEVAIGDAIPATLVEPDSLILMRIFRDAAHVNDTFPDAVFAWMADIHYQSSRLSTKNKAPNFFS